MSDQVFHHTVFPDTGACSKDLETLKKLTLEMYTTRAPELLVESLNHTETEEDNFYHETVSEARKYDEYHLHIFGPLDPWTYEADFFGINPTRPLTLFSVAVPELEKFGLTLKEGDLIHYDGVIHEVQTVKRSEDAYFAHTNYAFELIIATDVPNFGS